MIRVGPFQLMSTLGAGGMGEVWLAVHRKHEMTVAIKVMTAHKARNAKYRSAFEREARAAANLDHPHIVRVLDYGEVSAEAAGLSQGKLAAGTPYLAMELVEGGTLIRRKGSIEWPEFRHAALSLLDALAHAHARGVIHKDLKPGNVMLGDGRSGIKLTDFGLAHALHNEEMTSDTPLNALGGTPAYMAPEQFDGDNRIVGPWTDLYALGCLLWVLSTGKAPFGRKPWMQVAKGHLHTPLPPFKPQLWVPPGFEGWLRRLLVKNPLHRYRRAADAAWGLMQLKAALPRRAPRGSGPEPLELSETPTMAGPEADDRTTLIWGDAQSEEAEPTLGRRFGDGPALPRPPLPPLPRSWRRPTAKAPTARLIGTGLGLYHAREVPFVNRDSEREALWTELRQVRKRGRARLVVVRGASGVGKTRLVQWLCRRAHELGSAIVFSASHNAVGNRRDGLPAMVARHLRCMGLSFYGARERVAKELEGTGADEETVDALAEFVAPATREERESGARPVNVASVAERLSLVRGVIERACEERPTLVHLDDVQWGLDALELAQHMLEVQRYTPSSTLMVASVRVEDLNPRGPEHELLETLQRRDDVVTLEVDPLRPDHSRQLVQLLLALDGQLATRVEERVHGNPGFAVQLVGDWVQRDLLVRGEEGFILAPGAQVALPEDLTQAWRTTLARVLKGRSKADEMALELAATLGLHVDGREWRAVCKRAGVELSTTLVAALAAENLVRIAPEGMGGWSFTQGMLRETLEHQARSAGRWPRHNRVCAAVLRDRGQSELKRVAWHLRQAGEHRAAAPALLKAARRELKQGDLRAAALLMSDWEDSARAYDPAERESIWGLGWVLLAQIHRRRRQLDEAIALVDRALRMAVGGDDELLYRALGERAVLHQMTAEYEDAWDLQRRREYVARRRGDRAGVAECRTDQAWTLLHRGATGPARDLFKRSIRVYREVGQAAQAASAWMGLCEAARKARNYEHAREYLRRARACWEVQGSRWGIASALNNLADIERLEGKLDAAEQGYREAATRFEHLGLGATSIAHLNLALTLVGRRRFGEARALLEAYIDNLPPTLRSGHAFAHMVFLPVVAAEKRWSAFDRHAQRGLDLLEELGLVEQDAAEMLETAGLLAAKANELDRARRVLEAACNQYRSLRRTDRAERIETILRGLR